MFAKMIKPIIFSFLVSAGILQALCDEYPTSEMKEKIIQVHNECVQKLGVPDDIARTFDFKTKTNDIMCYMKCLMDVGQWAGDDEVPHYDEILKVTHPTFKEYVQKMFDSCRDIPPGEIAQLKKT